MTLFDHPIFRYIAPYAHITNERANVDFLQLPNDLRSLALDVETNCPACGALVKPIRMRAKSERSRVAGTAIERRLFYAPTCPTEVNSGCSRTVAARDHKKRVRRIFGLSEEIPDEAI